MKKSLLIFVLTALSLNAQPFRTDINPALIYYQAFNVVPDYSQEDRDYLFTNEWQSQPLPARFGNLVSGYDNEFRLFRQAAKSTVACDWGIDYSAGPETLLAHLSRIKMAANTARLRAMWDLKQDQQTNACEDLLAALALARNGSRDGSLISVLVQFASERIICATVAENFNHFSPELLSQIADGLTEAPSRGTVASAMENEKKFFAGWFTNQIAEFQNKSPGNDAKVMDEVHDLFNHAIGNSDAEQRKTNLWQQIIIASGGTSDGVVKLLRDMDPLYARLEAIESLPFAQYPEEMKVLSADLANSSNPFVTEFIPALEKCRPKEFAALADLAMVEAAVDYKLRGLPGLNSVTNPCGQGPFRYQRFVFEGVDRGFELSADYEGMGYPEVFIFVETDGPPFKVFGKFAGKTLEP